ncbi:hypothetical protein, partial [Frankia sp. AgB32]|uniref:hypothetical protein n=1 Tax=Frankia sp. AgB32 TaxID=631119 RepID=UPI00200D6FAA
MKAIETLHAREKAELKRTQKQATDRAMAEVRQSRKAFLARALDTFGIEREALITRQAADKDEIKARWRD